MTAFSTKAPIWWMMEHNPYRQAFYQRQARWHGYQGAGDVAKRHANRARYYEWHTRDWLPQDRDAPILDIGCGSGQFLYYLRQAGYSNAVGLDLDAEQVAIGRSLGLNCHCMDAFDFFFEDARDFAVIAMLDIIEHFTLPEAFELLEKVSERLAPGGRLIASVPNSESPTGLRCFHTDITHETSFTSLSFSQMMFSHDLVVREIRDPWPAPISPMRQGWSTVVKTARALEGLRLKLLGFETPTVWSPVFWAMAEKSLSGERQVSEASERSSKSSSAKSNEAPAAERRTRTTTVN